MVVLAQQPRRRRGAELGDADELAVRVRRRRCRDARARRLPSSRITFSASSGGCSVRGRVVLAPVGVDAQRRCRPATATSPRTDVAGVTGCRSTATNGPSIRSSAYNSEPGCCCSPSRALWRNVKCGIVRAATVDPVAADEADVGRCRRRRGRSTASSRGCACRGPRRSTWRVGGGRHQAAAAAGADDDGSHPNLLAASTRALSCRRAIERLASAKAQHETSVSMIASWATRLLIASGR